MHQDDCGVKQGSWYGFGGLWNLVSEYLGVVAVVLVRRPYHRVTFKSAVHSPLFFVCSRCVFLFLLLRVDASCSFAPL